VYHPFRSKVYHPFRRKVYHPFRQNVPLVPTKCTTRSGKVYHLFRQSVPLISVKVYHFFRWKQKLFFQFWE